MPFEPAPSSASYTSEISSTPSTFSPTVTITPTPPWPEEPRAPPPYLSILTLQITAETLLDSHCYFACLSTLTTLLSADNNSRLSFNIAQVHLLLNNTAAGLSFFATALAQDRFFAVAHFQRAVVLYTIRDYSAALAGFKDTLVAMNMGRSRGQIMNAPIEIVDYDQTGMGYVLKRSEVVFNCRLCAREVEGREGGGRGGGGEWAVFAVPAGAVFRVPARKWSGVGANVGRNSRWGFRGVGEVRATGDGKD